MYEFSTCTDCPCPMACRDRNYCNRSDAAAATLHERSKIRKEQLIAFVELCDAVVSTVKETGPQGAPAGSLYAALMSGGATLQQFEQFMSVLVRAGRLRKSGDLYFYSEPKQETGK